MRDTLRRRRAQGTLREMRTPEQDQCFVDFTSNDYLGMGRDAHLLGSIEREEARVQKVCIHIDCGVLPKATAWRRWDALLGSAPFALPVGAMLSARQSGVYCMLHLHPAVRTLLLID